MWLLFLLRSNLDSFIQRLFDWLSFLLLIKIFVTVHGISHQPSNLGTAVSPQIIFMENSHRFFDKLKPLWHSFCSFDTTAKLTDRFSEWNCGVKLFTLRLKVVRGEFPVPSNCTQSTLEIVIQGLINGSNKYLSRLCSFRSSCVISVRTNAMCWEIHHVGQSYVRLSKAMKEHRNSEEGVSCFTCQGAVVSQYAVCLVLLNLPELFSGLFLDKERDKIQVILGTAVCNGGRTLFKSVRFTWLVSNLWQLCHSVSVVVRTLGFKDLYDWLWMNVECLLVVALFQMRSHW